MDDRTRTGKRQKLRSQDPEGDEETGGVSTPSSPNDLSGLDVIGKRFSDNIKKGDKREAFRQFELDIARNFSAIILSGAGSQVKGFIDGILTLEEYRTRKTPEMDDNRKSPAALIEAFFTKPDKKEASP